MSSMKKRAIRITQIFLAVIAFYCAYNVWISYHQLTVNKFEVHVEENPSYVRLVVLSDLHDGTFGSENEELVQTVSSQQPDIIILDGDMLNDDSAAHEPVVKLIEYLKSACACPIYYALGNHEIGYVESHPEFWDDIEAAGAVYLEQNYVDITIGNRQLRIGGLYEYAFALDDFNSVDLEKMDLAVVEFLQDFRDTDAYKIMLAHRPDSFIFAEEPDYWDIDLVISGHVHGGQVVLPFLGELWAPDQGYFPTYVHGSYEFGDMTMLITSGLGSHRQALPRFGNRPEVMVVDITK